MNNWKCLECGHSFKKEITPECCPSCGEKQVFVTLTCNVPGWWYTGPEYEKLCGKIKAECECRKVSSGLQQRDRNTYLFNGEVNEAYRKTD